MVRSIMAFLLILLLASSGAAESSVGAALQAALAAKGPFYTWTLAEKAAFYDEHVYHGVGTRRGVPDMRHLPPETIRQNAPALLAACLGCDMAELASYTVDVDFWVEAFPEDESAEHEFYSVCFLQVDPEGGEPHNAYQMSVSAYSGEALWAIHLETGWTWERPS